mmetsp:Transcript_66378/g.192329  ORF Transcript_66378/g.192329 Transcript_66378/m.192329 type:complete len:384 (-) Transcript_66378:415-1566(-)
MPPMRLGLGVEVRRHASLHPRGRDVLCPRESHADRENAARQREKGHTEVGDVRRLDLEEPGLDRASGDKARRRRNGSFAAEEQHARRGAGLRVDDCLRHEAPEVKRLPLGDGLADELVAHGEPRRFLREEAGVVPDRVAGARGGVDQRGAGDRVDGKHALGVLECGDAVLGVPLKAIDMQVVGALDGADEPAAVDIHARGDNREALRQRHGGGVVRREDAAGDVGVGDRLRLHQGRDDLHVGADVHEPVVHRARVELERKRHVLRVVVRPQDLHAADGGIVQELEARADGEQGEPGASLVLGEGESPNGVCRAPPRRQLAGVLPHELLVVAGQQDTLHVRQRAVHVHLGHVVAEDDGLRPAADHPLNQPRGQNRGALVRVRRA